MGLVNEMSIDDLRQEKLDRVAEELVKSPKSKLVVSKDRLLKEIGVKLASLSPTSRMHSTVDLQIQAKPSPIIDR